jgi:hypothetical protein
MIALHCRVVLERLGASVANLHLPQLSITLSEEAEGEVKEESCLWNSFSVIALMKK